MSVLPDSRQSRILASLETGDFIWEVNGESYFTQFNDRSDRQSRVRRQEIEALDEQGWILRIRHDPAARRLDYYDITDGGREALRSALQRMGSTKAVRLVGGSASRAA